MKNVHRLNDKFYNQQDSVMTVNAPPNVSNVIIQLIMEGFLVIIGILISYKDICPVLCKLFNYF